MQLVAQRGKWQLRRGGAWENEHVVGAVLHSGLAHQFATAPFDAIAHDGAAQPPPDEDAEAGVRRVRAAVDHGEVRGFEPAPRAKDRRDFTRVGDAEPPPGRVCGRGGMHLLYGREATASFGAPALDDQAAAGRTHPFQKPVSASAPNFAGLIGDGHNGSS